MAIDNNDLSINTSMLNSRIQADDFQNRIYNNAGAGRNNLIQKINAYKSNNAGPSNFKFPLVTAKYYMRLDIADYNRADMFKLNFSKKASIILPMPENLIDVHSVSYEDAHVGVAAGNIANIAGAKIKNIFNNSDSWTDKARQLGDIFNTDNATAVAGAAAATIATQLKTLIKAELQKFLPDGAENAVTAIAGYSPNEFFTVLLRGPTYKNYNFTWSFFPKNKAESDQIKGICNLLNNSMAVKYAAGGAFWGFPDVFQLSYFPNSQYLNKFKPAVLKELQINFAPGKSPTFYAGKENQATHSSTAVNPPEAVTISATFEEMEYWLSGDFKDNNITTDTQGPRI